MEQECVKCSKCLTTYNKMFLMGKQGNIEVCPMCGSVMNGEEHPEWITWYYYGYKCDNGKTACLEDSPIDLSEHGDTFSLLKSSKPHQNQNVDWMKLNGYYALIFLMLFQSLKTQNQLYVVLNVVVRNSLY